MTTQSNKKKDYTLRYADVAQELRVDVRTVKRYVSEKKPYALTPHELWLPDGGGGQSRKVLVFSESEVARVRKQREKALTVQKKQSTTTSQKLPALDEQKAVMERVGSLVLAAVQEIAKDKDKEIAQLREAKGELKGEKTQLEHRLDDWKQQVEKNVHRSVTHVKESLKESFQAELKASIKQTRWKASVVTFGVTVLVIGVILVFLATRS